MIKDTNFIGNGAVSYILCDSCYVKIAECEEFQFMEGQELMYAGWMCKNCDRIRRKDHGDKTQRVEELEKEIKKLKEQFLVN